MKTHREKSKPVNYKAGVFSDRRTSASDEIPIDSMEQTRPLWRTSRMMESRPGVTALQLQQNGVKPVDTTLCLIVTPFSHMPYVNCLPESPALRSRDNRFYRRTDRRFRNELDQARVRSVASECRAGPADCRSEQRIRCDREQRHSGRSVDRSVQRRAVNWCDATRTQPGSPKRSSRNGGLLPSVR